MRGGAVHRVGLFQRHAACVAGRIFHPRQRSWCVAGQRPIFFRLNGKPPCICCPAAGRAADGTTATATAAYCKCMSHRPRWRPGRPYASPCFGRVAMLPDPESADHHSPTHHQFRHPSSTRSGGAPDRYTGVAPLAAASPGEGAVLAVRRWGAATLLYATQRGGLHAWVRPLRKCVFCVVGRGFESRSRSP